MAYFGNLIPKKKGQLVLEKNQQESFVYFVDHNSKELWQDVLIFFDDLSNEYAKLFHSYFKKFFHKKSYILNPMMIQQLDKMKQIMCDTA